jgi:hypothetical protein
MGQAYFARIVAPGLEAGRFALLFCAKVAHVTNVAMNNIIIVFIFDDFI